MIKQERKRENACGIAPQASRLPYGAPRIETHRVELEGGIAANSAVIKGSSPQFNINDYTTSQDEQLQDVELL